MDLRDPVVLSLLSELLARDAVVSLAVAGNSMRPLLAGGETVLLRRVPPNQIRRGDLLLCQYSRQEGVRLLLHRVVAIHRRPELPALIHTQGDALGTPDVPVTEGQVLGRVCAIRSAQPAAELISLDTRSQRMRGLWIALRQRGWWWVRLISNQFLRPLRQATSSRARKLPEAARVFCEVYTTASEVEC